MLALLNGMSARLARGPLLCDVVERIDRLLAQREPGSLLTRWVCAVEVLGSDETLGRMLLELLPIGFVAYALEANPQGNQGLSTWPSHGGGPSSTARTFLQFDAGMVPPPRITP